jgi:hypothetical protein
MSKKIKCPKCSGGFLPTLAAFAQGEADCPACHSKIPLVGAQAMDAFVENCARARFATGAPVLLDAGNTNGDEFDIQWMPPGEQAPVAFVADEPRKLEFTVKAQHALAFDAMLQRLRQLAAAGSGDLPFIDFNHEDGAASGRPTQIYWGGDDAKRGGIRLKGKWTASGKAAVTGEAPEYTRFSPEWYFDDHDEPIAIGANLGGLVNKAAFKTIASVKAGSSGSHGAANQQQKNNMTKEEISLALSEALKPITAEIAALKTAQAKGTETTTDETALTKAVAKAMEPFTAKIEAVETNTRKAQAKSAIAKYVTAPGNAQGVIAPADTKSIEFWETAYLANAADAEDQLKKLGARTPARVIIAAGNGGTGTGGTTSFSEPENRAIAGARKLRETNKAIASDAEALEAYFRTAEGNALYAEILVGRTDESRGDVQLAR